jgi:hypothetical protein
VPCSLAVPDVSEVLLPPPSLRNIPVDSILRVLSCLHAFSRLPVHRITLQIKVVDRNEAYSCISFVKYQFSTR